MTDVQVSNARRIGFTALALVAFWVLAWLGYWLIYDGFLVFEFIPFPDSGSSATIGLALALVPTMFCSIAAHGFVICLRDRGDLLAGGLFTTSIGLSVWLGLSDARIAVSEAGPQLFGPLRFRIEAALDYHEVSWQLLLPPIILTTTFVIFGAWRSAVRDRARGDVEEVAA